MLYYLYYPITRVAVAARGVYIVHECDKCVLTISRPKRLNSTLGRTLSPESSEVMTYFRVKNSDPSQKRDTILECCLGIRTYNSTISDYDSSISQTS